jgi:hypothetical protein
MIGTAEEQFDPVEKCKIFYLQKVTIALDLTCQILSTVVPMALLVFDTAKYHEPFGIQFLRSGEYES